MELEHLPLQYRLIQSVSEYLFNSSEASCAVLVSKTPYLSALVACSGARTVIMPPFSVGDCLLLPLEKPDIYVHVVIDRYCEEINGQLICYLKYSKNNSNKNRKITTIELDKGVKGKPNKFVEEKGFLFPTQCEDNWLGKHAISLIVAKSIISLCDRLEQQFHPNMATHGSQIINLQCTLYVQQRMKMYSMYSK